MTDIADNSCEPISRHFHSQGLKLHYLDWGNQGAPTLLLLHGMRDHARSWDWTARALRHEYHVVALDLRGHGDSDWSSDHAYGLPYHMVDLVDLIDTLGEEPISIVSHSYSGNTSSRYAGLFPERVNKLVVVDGLGPTPAIARAWASTAAVERMTNFIAHRRASALREGRRMANIAEAVERMAKANPHLSPDQVQHLAIHGVREYADGYGWKYDPLVNCFPAEEFAVDAAVFWQMVTAPTLLFWGSESWVSNPEEDGRAVHFRDHHTIVFDRAGHWLHHDRFDDFIAELRAFL